MDFAHFGLPSRRRSADRLFRSGVPELPVSEVGSMSSLPDPAVASHVELGGIRESPEVRRPPIDRRLPRLDRKIVLGASATIVSVAVAVLGVTGNLGWPAARRPANSQVLETLPFAEPGDNVRSIDGSTPGTLTASQTAGSLGDVRPAGSQAESGGRSVAQAGQGSTSAVTVPATVVVHAAGAVKFPGVYVLPIEARVDDVLHAAGGAEPAADLDVVNLAQPIKDGDRVFFPRVGQPTPVPVTLQNVSAPQSSIDGPMVGPLDLNTATAEQLDALPGVGPATAQRIIEFREQNNGFRSVNQLLDVPGIGESKLAALKAKVRA